MTSTKETKRGATSPRDAAAEPEEVGDTILCDHDPCTCEEASVVRGRQRYCSERCAEMAEDLEGVEDETEEAETCACGHAECEASVTAGAGGEGERRQPPRTPPGRV